MAATVSPRGRPAVARRHRADEHALVLRVGRFASRSPSSAPRGAPRRGSTAITPTVAPRARQARRARWRASTCRRPVGRSARSPAARGAAQAASSSAKVASPAGAARSGPAPAPVPPFRPGAARARGGPSSMRPLGLAAPPAPPPAARSARGRASRRRSRGPTRWQNSTEAGSPPCSPQMPSLRSGVRRAAALDGDARSAAPTPSLVERQRTGRAAKMLVLDVVRQERAGVVAREAERRLGQVVGAEARRSRRARRSRSATSAARGTSIIVPTR